MTSRVVGKRRRADIREDLSTLGLTRAFEEAIETKPNAEMVVLHLIDRYNFDLNELLTKIAGMPPFLLSTNLLPKIA